MRAAASGSTRVRGTGLQQSPRMFLEEERKDMTIQRSFLDEVRGSDAKTNRWNLTHQNGGPLLQSIPLRERPVYRVSYQVKDCNVLELLAALVGGKDQMEVAAALLSRFESLQSLSRATIHELTSVYGIGLARAACVKAALELGQRRMISQEDHAPTIQSPDDAAALLLPLMQDLEQEHLYVLILDTRNRIIGEPLEIYHGSLNSSLVRVAELFRPAIQANAAAILIAHCHPSGDPTPSPEDVAITRAVVQAGKLLDVACIDHIIIGRGRFVSLKSRGLGFN